MHSPAAAKTASVHAVDDHAGHAMPLARSATSTIAGDALGGELPQVVLAEEDHGQAVQRSHVRRLVNALFVRCTVAEEAD
jgi:hypothetical protein